MAAMRSFRGRFFAPALAAALLSTSCGPEPVDDQVLRYGNGSELQTLDPHLATGVPEGRVLRAIYEGLVTLDPESLKPLPGVAEEWESADGVTWTFRLRPDVYALCLEQKRSVIGIGPVLIYIGGSRRLRFSFFTRMHA